MGFIWGLLLRNDTKNYETIGDTYPDKWLHYAHLSHDSIQCKTTLINLITRRS
jgi:hypothetical protein